MGRGDGVRTLTSEDEEILRWRNADSAEILC